jgi:hypothetical protein
MDRLFARRITSFLAVISLALFLVTTLYGSGSTASLALFAEQIIQEINALKADTSAASLPHHKQRRLNRSLDRAIGQMDRGIDYLQKDKIQRANHKFRKAEYHVDEYIRQLHWHKFILRLLQWHPFSTHLYDQGDQEWIETLIANAKDIKKQIRQLIRGEVSNNAPLANAGPDQSVQSGQMVTLDGSASSDPDGDTLQFNWEITSQPVSSDVVLSDSNVATPSFTPVVAGTYIIELTVADESITSQPDSVTISVAAANTQPIANAGSDQTGVVGDSITLDGTASSDVDGDNLSFDWSLITLPEGSNSTLDDPTNVRPTFIPDIPGLYQAQLLVNDGQLDSLTDVVDIQIDNQNTKPVADAGPDQSVYTNQLVQLNGSSSSWQIQSYCYRRQWG